MKFRKKHLIVTIFLGFASARRLKSEPKKKKKDMTSQMVVKNGDESQGTK